MTAAGTTMSRKGILADIPRSSGVYQILCTHNAKIYVGSTVDFRARWHGHRLALRNRAHPNRHLQKAWNRYGELGFEFSILQLVGAADLLTAEQSWIDRTGCTHRKLGFNIFPLAGSPGGTFARTWRGFRDPSGTPITIVNLFDFCRRNDLDFPSMHRLAQGRSKLKSYKGWTHENSVRRREYIKSHLGFIDPSGQSVGKIINLAAFCRAHGLDTTHMVAVANGRIIAHHGWTHQSGRLRQPPKQYTGFIAPDGTRSSIVNLNAFCKERGLCIVHMHEVKSGRRRQHKGWTWREHDEQAASQ